MGRDKFYPAFIGCLYEKEDGIKNQTGWLLSRLPGKFKRDNSQLGNQNKKISPLTKFAQ